MKNKTFILIITVLISWSVTAQQKNAFEVYGIHIDTLKQMVQKHPKYFKYLQKKWLETPQKLDDDEMILLYYGSAFMQGYQSKQEDKDIEKIAQAMAEFDFGTALKEGEKLRKVYPLNARLYMLLGYAYKQTGDKAKSKFYYRNHAKILRVPLFSGDGKSFKKAFVVRTISDEFLILNYKNLELVQQEVRYHHKIPFDVMLIQPQSADNQRAKVLLKEKLYFNIYLPFFTGQGKTYKMLQEEAKEKMQRAQVPVFKTKKGD